MFKVQVSRKIATTVASVMVAAAAGTGVAVAVTSGGGEPADEVTLIGATSSDAADTADTEAPASPAETTTTTAAAPVETTTAAPAVEATTQPVAAVKSPKPRTVKGMNDNEAAGPEPGASTSSSSKAADPEPSGSQTTGDDGLSDGARGPGEVDRGNIPDDGVVTYTPPPSGD